jgi:hypothetical protein
VGDVTTILPWLVYFLPMLLAILLRNRRWIVVGLVNLLLGWTIIGWFVALVLAFSLQKRPPPVWDGVHRVTVRGGGGMLPVWGARCPCGWQSSSWSLEEMQVAANQLPHPAPRQAYYAGPG